MKNRGEGLRARMHVCDRRERGGKVDDPPPLLSPVRERRKYILYPPRRLTPVCVRAGGRGRGNENLHAHGARPCMEIVRIGLGGGSGGGLGGGVKGCATRFSEKSSLGLRDVVTTTTANDDDEASGG